MYYDKFIDNFTEKNSPTKEYYDYLELFYSPISSCPKCKSKIYKNKENDIIKIKCTKCKWEIVIDVAKYVNLHNVFYNKKMRKINLMYELTEKIKRNEKIDIEELKSIDLYDIEKIFDDQKEAIDKAILDQFKNINKLYLLYNDKKNIYNSIIEKVTKGNSNKLMEEFNSKKNVKDMVKKTGLSEFTVKKWFEWLGVVKEYVKLSYKIKNETDNIRKMINDNLKLNTNFLVKSGIVKESKNIKL